MLVVIEKFYQIFSNLSSERSDSGTLDGTQKNLVFIEMINYPQN